MPVGCLHNGYDSQCVLANLFCQHCEGGRFKRKHQDSVVCVCSESGGSDDSRGSSVVHRQVLFQRYDENTIQL